MPIPVSCPACNAEFRVGDELAGRKVKCSGCGKAIAIPGKAKTAANQSGEMQESVPKMAAHAPPRPSREDEDDEATTGDRGKREQQRRKVRRRQHPTSIGPVMWIAGGFLVLAAAVSAAVGLILFMAHGAKDDRNEVISPAPMPIPARATPSPAAPVAFLDQKTTVPAGMEWNREVVARKGGPITFRISTPGSFSFLVVTGELYRAIKARKDLSPAQRQNVLLQSDADKTYQGSVILPPGSSYFIIKNNMNTPAEIHLECFPPG